MGILNFFTSRKSTQNAQTNAGAGMNGSTTAAPMVGLHSKPMDMDTYLASDDKEWLKYLSQPLRTYRKPGLSMKEEHELWLSARARSRAMMANASAKV